MILTSALLASLPRVRHAFSTRLGGVSTGPFATLNVDRGVGDDDARVLENRARFLRAAGFPDRSNLVQVVQVHGTRVLDARHAAGESADGLFAVEPRDVVGVRTADCAPILIVALDGRGRPEAVAALHAGWRGATAGILPEALTVLEDLGARRERMRFAIGPTIGVEAFEVGEEVVEAARAALGGREPPLGRGARGRPHLDLRGLLVEQLVDRAVHRAAIELVGGSTHADPELYYSYRRDGGRTGRHLSAIGLVDAA